MSDQLRAAGVVVAHLSRAILDGSRDLRTVPGLVKRIIADDMWRAWADPKSGREYGPFGSFPEFVVASAANGGLGCSTVDQLRNLCAEDTEARDAIDRACQNPVGTHVHDNIMVSEVGGTSQVQALRKLRKDAPELHAEVIAGNLSAHAAMIQAGYRPKTISVPISKPDAVARSLLKHMSPGDIAKLITALTEGDPHG